MELYKINTEKVNNLLGRKVNTIHGVLKSASLAIESTNKKEYYSIVRIVKHKGYTTRECKIKFKKNELKDFTFKIDTDMLIKVNNDINLQKNDINLQKNDINLQKNDINLQKYDNYFYDTYSIKKFKENTFTKAGITDGLIVIFPEKTFNVDKYHHPIKPTTEISENNLYNALSPYIGKNIIEVKYMGIERKRKDNKSNTKAVIFQDKNKKEYAIDKRYFNKIGRKKMLYAFTNTERVSILFDKPKLKESKFAIMQLLIEEFE